MEDSGPPTERSHWFKSTTELASDVREAEEYELQTPESPFFSSSARLLGKQPSYEEGGIIDWWHEEAAERERRRVIVSRHGLQGLMSLVLDSAKMWLVIILTGVGIGTVGAWLDILVRWLGDLREGRCSYGFFYNQVTCCSGMGPGEICGEWQTWSDFLGVRFIFAQSLLQSFIYVALAIAFAGSSAVLVKAYAPYAFHTGIPEIKAILSGYVLDAFLSPWTLIIKALGLALAVASGLSLGKEGPLVHISCCMAYLLSKMFKQFHHNEAQKRKMLTAAAVAGVSVAFGSPLGGVLFGLEELDTFASGSDAMWRGFVTSSIAAMTLQYIDPFGTSKLVLFQVTEAATVWRAFELIPWLFLAVIGGLLGSAIIKLNAAIAVYRHNSALQKWPTLEVVGFTAITAAVSYLVVFLRVQSSELVANLFQECDPNRMDYHGLCNATAIWANIFLLTLTALTKVVLTAWTFGMRIPAGIFLPTIAIGACLGRAVGLLTQGLYHSYPNAWIFSSCPPDITVRCISPGFYAVIGASALLAGVTRMTVSLVVILFELTGALSHVLPIMISVMVAKWVADAFGKEGIYAVWIAMRRYPWVPPTEFHDRGETAAKVMKPAQSVVVIRDDGAGCALLDLELLMRTHRFHGFPVVREDQLLGYVTRDGLWSALESLLAEDAASGVRRKCTFSSRAASADGQLIDLSDVLEEAVMKLRKEVPLELVVSMFQKLNVRHILFSDRGKLAGMVTKTDIVWLLTAHSPYTAALSEKSRGG